VRLPYRTGNDRSGISHQARICRASASLAVVGQDGGEFLLSASAASLTLRAMHRFPTKWLADGLLAVMAVLMIGASRQDSATVDETTHLAAGYSYWLGYRYRMAANHPALSQMLEGAPLLAMNVKVPPIADGILKGRIGYAWMVPWSGPPRSIQDLLPAGCRGKQAQFPPLGDVLVMWECPRSYPIDNWYYWAVPECQMFSKYLFYDGTNDGDAMLFAGRLVQIALTLLTGLVIFIWTRRTTGNDGAALLGLALWTFNPSAIAYGHMTNTDIGVTFGMTLALYFWARFLEKPTQRLAIFCGVATGIALTMKFTAIILAPIFVVTLAISWKRLKLPVSKLAKLAGISLLAMWAVILIVYFPRWAPVRPPTDVEIATLGIPGWFRSFRPILIPPDFWKVIAMALAKSGSTTGGYLMGEWSDRGWWYYFPATFVLKSSVAFVILTAAGLWLFMQKARKTQPLEYVTWLAAGIYLASAMTSHVNLGVRHLLPMLALLCIGIGCAVNRLADRRLKIAAYILAGWQAVAALFAYPLYIQFFSEAVGGASNGYKYLVDSNYDWGQDAHRLKAYLDAHGIRQIYLSYFGTQFSISYLGIPNTRVDAESAKQIRDGYLVVSVSELMRPEWDWLRKSRAPIDRVAHTLFVYKFGAG
jgi:hypothetical protein